MAYTKPALNTPVGIYVANAVAADVKYGPYTSITDPNQVGDVFHEDSPIFDPLTRPQGLVIGFLSGGAITEYWFRDGIDNIDLIVKAGSQGDGTVKSVNSKLPDGA